MSALIRLIPLLSALVALSSSARADDRPARTEIARRAKSATALLQYGTSSATAFCVHPSGLFVTNDHALRDQAAMMGVNATPKLVLDSNLKSQKIIDAKIIRRDKDLDLALLKIESQPGPVPTLRLGNDEKLEELAELIAFGFPFGQMLASNGRYPSVSVNLGSVTALRRDAAGLLHRIQLDAELNPGNSGGPVLDESGAVIGVVVSGIRGAGINQAIPVSQLSRFLARPEFIFSSPVVPPAKADQLVEFRAELVSLVPDPTSYDLELKVGQKGKQRRFAMKPDGGAYSVSAVAFPPREGPVEFRMKIDYGEGASINGVVSERDVNFGTEVVKLSQIRQIILGEKDEVTFRDGRKITAVAADLDTVPIRVGPQSLDVKFAGAKTITLQAPDPSDVVSCQLVARQAGKDVGAICAPVYLEGAEQKSLDSIRDGRFSRPIATLSPVSFLSAYSVPGDHIGAGKTYMYERHEMIATPTQRGFKVQAGGFNFEFGGPNGRFLEARVYLDAKRLPFSGESPGMEIMGNGRGSGALVGKFVVWEFAVKDKEVERLAIDFVQYSDGKSTPFYGKIRINSNFH
jgi:hypothetical protein